MGARHAGAGAWAGRRHARRHRAAVGVAALALAAVPCARRRALPPPMENAPGTAGAFHIATAVSRGGGLLPGLGRLGEPLAEGAKLLQLRLAQLVVALLEIPHRLVEPGRLILGLRADDTALHDVLEHLIARFLERRRSGGPAGTVVSDLFGHVVIRGKYPVI